MATPSTLTPHLFCGVMLVFNQYKSFIDIIIYVRGAIGFGNFAECNMEFSSSFINFYTCLMKKNPLSSGWSFRMSQESIKKASMSLAILLVHRSKDPFINVNNSRSSGVRRNVKFSSNFFLHARYLQRVGV